MVVRVRPTKALLMDVNLLNTERAFARRHVGLDRLRLVRGRQPGKSHVGRST